jgi:hypothetical protein
MLKVRYVALALLASPLAAQASEPAKAATASDPDKVICKRQFETGSLVKSTKTCMTRREWERQASQSRDLGDTLQSHVATEQGREDPH